MPAIPQTRLADDLRGASARGEVVVHYQPQVALPGRRVVAVEALARWQHPDFGLITPTDFIPAAESAGIIGALGHHILEIAVKQAAAWEAVGLPLGLSVNVSPTQLVEDDYCENVSEVVKRYNIDPGQLTIELTETEPIIDLPSVVECLDHIRESGVGVSIDDFGAGHTSLEVFRILPATELKIDQSIIRGSTDEAMMVIGEAMREAQDRGIRVVAEGVETQAHLDLALWLGCDRAQGFLLGRPMDADALESVLAAG